MHFEVSHFGTSLVRGRFGPLEGRVQFDPDARTGRVELRIPTAIVSTGIAPLDARLRGADFLASDAFPEAFYVAERFVFDGRVPREIRGELTLRGTSLPVALAVQRFQCYPSPLYAREVCGGDFVAEIGRGDFGITWGRPFVGERVRLLIQVEAIRQ